VPRVEDPRQKRGNRKNRERTRKEKRVIGGGKRKNLRRIKGERSTFLQVRRKADQEFQQRKKMSRGGKMPRGLNSLEERETGEDSFLLKKKLLSRPKERETEGSGYGGGFG